jgi:hypothetical protein
MEQLIERCAGLDVGKRTVAATVRIPGTGKRRQTMFSSRSRDGESNPGPADP